MDNYGTGLTIIALGVVIAVIGIVLHFKFRKIIDYKTYSGKVVFEKEEDYAAFKRAVGHPSITSFDATVLSSSPPIVVQFSAEATPDGDLRKYGKEHIHGKEAGFFPMFIIGIFFTLLGILVLTVL